MGSITGAALDSTLGRYCPLEMVEPSVATLAQCLDNFPDQGRIHTVFMSGRLLMAPDRF
jgi:hypothetical protein